MDQFGLKLSLLNQTRFSVRMARLVRLPSNHLCDPGTGTSSGSLLSIDFLSVEIELGLHFLPSSVKNQRASAVTGGKVLLYNMNLWPETIEVGSIEGG